MELKSIQRRKEGIKMVHYKIPAKWKKRGNSWWIKEQKHTKHTQNNIKMPEVNPSLSISTSNVNRLNST